MVLPTHTTTKSAKETQELGKQLGDSLLESEWGLPHVICLWGELGSGKTTFTQGVAHGLGITSRLLSPTFIIVRRYDIPKKSWVLYHMDLYRIYGKNDADGIGFTDMLHDPNALVIVEWPDRLLESLPEIRIDIHFKSLADGSHTIRISQYGK